VGVFLDRLIRFENKHQTRTRNNRSERIGVSYKNYLNTKHWKSIKSEVIEKKGRRCFICDNTKNLHIHHRYYKIPATNKNILHNEKINALMPLCAKCHGLWHKYHGRRILWPDMRRRCRKLLRTGYKIDEAIRFCVFVAVTDVLLGKRDAVKKPVNGSFVAN
jgi:hypothetical protein